MSSCITAMASISRCVLKDCKFQPYDALYFRTSSSFASRIVSSHLGMFHFVVYSFGLFVSMLVWTLNLAVFNCFIVQSHLGMFQFVVYNLSFLYLADVRHGLSSIEGQITSLANSQKNSFSPIVISQSSRYASM